MSAHRRRRFRLNLGSFPKGKPHLQGGHARYHSLILSNIQCYNTLSIQGQGRMPTNVALGKAFGACTVQGCDCSRYYRQSGDALECAMCIHLPRDHEALLEA